MQAPIAFAFDYKMPPAMGAGAATVGAGGGSKLAAGLKAALGSTWDSQLKPYYPFNRGGADIDLMRRREAASSMRSIALSGRWRSWM